MRRPLLLLVVLTAACGATWAWLRPGDLRLGVDPRCREIALLFPAEADGRRTSAAATQAIAELAAPEQRATLRAGLAHHSARQARRVTVAFVPGQPAVLGLDTPEVPADGKVIPSLARIQLGGVPHGYLLVRAAPAQGLLEVAARRRWLGRALIEAGTSAETATVAVGESDDGAFLVATIAFAYRTSEEAEAAFARLTEKQGDFEALGFAARPGADRITRQTKLLVVRFDIETDLVLQALGRR